MNGPPEIKRAAPSRATHDAKTDTANDSALSEGVQYAVYCIKANGARVEFKRYEIRDEAEAVARHLRTIGCPAAVEVRHE